MIENPKPKCGLATLTMPHVCVPLATPAIVMGLDSLCCEASFPDICHLADPMEPSKLGEGARIDE